MINLKALNEESQMNEGLNFETKVPYGIYDAQLISLQRRYETEKQRERIMVTYKILNGDYQNCAIRDNYYLSEKVSRNSQIFQYKKMKTFFTAIDPEIDFTLLETMDQVEKSLPYYLQSVKSSILTIKYYTDENNFDQVSILKRNDSPFKEEEDEEKMDLPYSEMEE